MGEGVAEAGTTFKVLTGSSMSSARIISRYAHFRSRLHRPRGAAMTGLRPIVDIMFGDFLTIIMGCWSTRRPNHHVRGQ